MPNWKKWQKLSDQARSLDTCLQACNCVARGWYHCDCNSKDEQAWLKDYQYIRKFEPRPVRPVNKDGAFVIKRNSGHIEGPYRYHEWLEYSYELFVLVHDVMEGKKEPS